MNHFFHLQYITTRENCVRSPYAKSLSYARVSISSHTQSLPALQGCPRAALCGVLQLFKGAHAQPCAESSSCARVPTRSPMRSPPAVQGCPRAAICGVSLLCKGAHAHPSADYTYKKSKILPLVDDIVHKDRSAIALTGIAAEAFYWFEESASFFHAKVENARLLATTILREIVTKRMKNCAHCTRTCNVVKSCATPQTRQKVQAWILA
jgi:hypothetical protein